MKKLFTHGTANFMKAAALILLMLGGVQHAKAQTTVTVGTGTSTGSNVPITSCYGYTYSQQIYSASAISAAGGSTSIGQITKLRFYFSSGASTNSTDWTVYIGNSTKSAFTSTTDWEPLSSLTNVFSGTVTYPSAGNWLEITLSTPFTWDGTSNLVVAIDENESGYYCSNNWRYTSTSGTYTSIYYRSDGTNPNPASPPTASGRNYYYPNAQFYFQSNCSGSPTAGTASITPSTGICLGTPTTLSVSGATADAGITYQWQQSATGSGGWSNITGATTATYSVTPTAVTYYRCLVSCTPSGLGNYTNTVSVSFNYNILTTTAGTRCGTGTTSLQATGTTGATMKWYAAATGGSSLGSGSPFTTPTISSTTNFFVSAESVSSGTGISPSGTSSGRSNSGQTPFGQYYESGHVQYLVMASDLAAAGFGAGNISGLSFNVTSKSSYLNHDGYTIKFAHSTATSLSGLLSPTFTTVYGPTNYYTSLGANNFSFATSFLWNGTSNVLVDVCFDNATTGTSWSNSDAVSFVSTSYTGTYGVYDDYTNLCGSSSGYSSSFNGVPQMTFTGTKVCSSPRVSVTATVNTAPTFGITGTQTVCNNSVATMSVTSTLSSYNTYTWSPATGLFTDAGCTTAYTTGTSASIVYSKTTTAGTIKYFCTANNTTSLCSGLDSASVTTLPSAITAVATPSSICVSGNTTLDISPSVAGFGAAQYQWQTSANNSTWGDSTGRTTSSLTTNTLTGTRYYRVVLKNGSGTTCINSSSDTALVHNPAVASVTNGQRCAPGTVNIGATPSSGTSIYWYTAATGGTAIASGSTYTTPFLTGTTTYYAESAAIPNINATVGDGSSSTSTDGISPFSQWWESARTQYLIPASELSALGITAGSFGTMSFEVSSKNSSQPYVGYTIKFAHTSATSLSGYLTPTFTTVYGPTSYTTALGVNSFTLGGGFAWDGTSNLLVEVCFSNAGGTSYTITDGVKATSKSYNGVYGTYYDGVYLCAASGSLTATSSTRPDITLTRQGCVSARSAVVATINPLPTPTISPATGPIQICAGSTTTFTGTGGGNYQWRDATGPLSGETASTFTTGTTGSYRVIVTNPTTGCKDSTAAVGVNVNPVPTVSIAPAGTTQICEDSSQLFTSVVTGSGLSYKWYNSGTVITGETKDTLRRNTSGVYTLRVFLGTCSDTSNEATFIVNPLPAASFTKTGATGAICLGSTLELTALTVPTGSSYQWLLNGMEISGANGQKYYAPTGGIYTVRIKDANNCRKMSDTLSIINTPMGIPNLSPSEARFCEGTELKLYANAGPFASKFAWTRNGTSLVDTTENIVSAINGVYDVTVTDVYGCVLTSPKAVLTIDAIPVKPVINKSGMVLTTAAPYVTYQWFRNGKAIAGATFRSYTLMFDGNYHVVVTNAADCFNVSDTIALQNLSVKALVRNDLDIKVYPNPSQDKVMIDAPIEVNLMIKDMQGKQVLQVNNATQVDMSVYADGIYFFTITDKEGMVVKMDKIVKRTN